MIQWVKDLVLSLVCGSGCCYGVGFNSWPWNFYELWMQPKKKKEGFLILKKNPVCLLLYPFSFFFLLNVRSCSPSPQKFILKV